MDGCMDGWMDGWMDRLMDGWMDGWMDGLVDERYPSIHDFGILIGITAIRCLAC